MTTFSDLSKVDALCKRYGISAAQVIVWAAQAGFGVDARIVQELNAEPEPTNLQEVIEEMAKLAIAIAALTATVQPLTDRLNAVETYVQGVPNLVAAAVTDALKNAGVDDEALAAAVDQARVAVEKEVSDVLNAIIANAPAPTSEPQPDVQPTPVEPPPV